MIEFCPSLFFSKVFENFCSRLIIFSCFHRSSLTICIVALHCDGVRTDTSGNRARSRRCRSSWRSPDIDNSLLSIRGITEKFSISRLVATWCERMVYRHGAILLIVRRHSGFIPQRYRHWRWSAGQSASRVWKRRGKRRRETREGQTRRDRQRTLKAHIMDGMKMERSAHTDTLGGSSWAMQWVCTVWLCANCTRKTTCEVSLSTPPVGYNGSPSTVNKTVTKKKIT